MAFFCLLSYSTPSKLCRYDFKKATLTRVSDRQEGGEAINDRSYLKHSEVAKDPLLVLSDLANEGVVVHTEMGQRFGQGSHAQNVLWYKIQLKRRVERGRVGMGYDHVFFRQNAGCWSKQFIDTAMNPNPSFPTPHDTTHHLHPC